MKKDEDTLPSLCPKKIILSDYILQSIFYIEKKSYDKACETMKTFSITLKDINKFNTQVNLDKFKEYLDIDKS